MSSEHIKFNPNIHGLRGLASFFVLIYHIYRSAITAGYGVVSQGYNFWPDDIIHYYLSFILQTLNSGIELFFMISGYLITATLIKLQSTKQFAINRCLRIYPAFLATQCVMFTIGPIIGWDWMVNLSVSDYLYYLLINLLFLPGVFNFNIALPAAWTLSFEALFYIVSGSIYSLSLVVRPLLISLLIAVTSLWTFFYLPTATFFIPGVLAYFIGKRWPQYTQKLKIPGLPFLSFVIMVEALSLTFVHDNKFYYFIVSLVSLLTFMYIVNGYGVIAFILRTRAFQFLGTISYSLYLWQVPIMFPIKRIILKLFTAHSSPYLVFYSVAFCSLFFALICSYISFKIFEDYIPRKIYKKYRKPTHTLNPQTAGIN